MSKHNHGRDPRRMAPPNSQTASEIRRRISPEIDDAMVDLIASTQHLWANEARFARPGHVVVMTERPDGRLEYGRAPMNYVLSMLEDPHALAAPEFATHIREAGDKEEHTWVVFQREDSICIIRHFVRERVFLDERVLVLVSGAPR